MSKEQIAITLVGVDYFRGIGDYHNSCYKCKSREKETKTTACR